jgi:hypothetical protein
MKLEPISTACFINPSHQSMCLFVYPTIFARQRLRKHVPAATNTRNNRRIIRGVVLYWIRIVSNECLWVCLCIPLSLLSNGSVNTFPQQRKIVGGVVFYAARVLSKESRRLVLTRTSCLLHMLGFVETFYIYILTLKINSDSFMKCLI